MALPRADDSAPEMLEGRVTSQFEIYLIGKAKRPTATYEAGVPAPSFLVHWRRCGSCPLVCSGRALYLPSDPTGDLNHGGCQKQRPSTPHHTRRPIESEAT